MNSDWQTWAALAVVAITAVLYVRRVLGKRKKRSGGSCGGDCGCDKNKPNNVK